jgi:hypothetical protein
MNDRLVKVPVVLFLCLKRADSSPGPDYLESNLLSD